MSILDDAIREHLELKRAHGADDAEVQRLEDEAFGPPQRPDQADPFAEAPTEFLVSPGETPAALAEIGDEAERSGRRPNITDLQEPPPVEAPVTEDAAPAPPEDALSPAPDAPPPSPAAADAPLPPPVDGAAEPPAAEEHPAGEHEIVPDAGPGTEERQALADQPTQMFDVQAEIDAQPEVPVEQASPTDEELVDAAQGEPQAAPPAPEEPAGPPTEEESAEFDFFNEQRLSDELDQALEAPLPSTDEHGLPGYEDAAPAEGGIFDFESGAETYEEDPSEETPRDPAEPPSEESDIDYDPDTGHEDVLEDTPKFLADAPEDDDLWFEQKPPKDFDLD